MRRPLLLSVLAAALLSMGAVAQDESTSITAPRWLDPPKVDGQCDDPAYERGESFTMRGSDTRVSILHSSVDLYLCLEKAGEGERISVGLDPDLSGDGDLETGDAVFHFTAEGAVKAEQGDGRGGLVPLSITEADAEAGYSGDGAEVRISLEWLGGYGRTAGLGFSIEGRDGSRSWPDSADPFAPGSFGEVALAPVYPQGTEAGSVFLDGREGHLVVPYSPELNPEELTVEAWVRAVDGDCGTLVGNGQASSYWLALCEGVRFGHGGASTVRGVSHPLGDGWHHVAATFDPAGIRTLYVDGSVVLQPGWEPPREVSEDEEREVEILGSSTLPLRIGSDRDDPERDPLHGYVRELRIWSRARTAEEIREDAFENLRGGEEGLVALWPFTADLRDIAGGHHAGLIGSASLARDEPRVSEFPDPPKFEPYDYPAKKPLPAWNPRVPAIADNKAITLDGDCTFSEYGRAAKLSMEPDRSIHMKLLVAGDSLYLCSNVLAGRTGSASSAVTLWIDRDNKPASQPGPTELRIRLTPEGKLVVGTGSGAGYNGAAPAGIQAKTLSGDRLQAQEDLKPFTAPWWSGEIRIPLKALSPFAPGSTLRFALAYDGEAPTVSGQPRAFRERWPASFQELRSDTWGTSPSDRPAQALSAASEDGISSIFEPVINSGPRTPVSTARTNELPDPAPPTVARFAEICGWPFVPTEPNFAWEDDPRNLAYVFDSDLKWPLVDSARPIAQVSGTLTKVYVSGEDSHYIHTSHDVDMKVTLPQADQWATVGGADNLVLETESAGFPPNNDRDLGARPSVNDHVTVLGRWIFDCGHEPKTEIHPIPMFESDRLEVRPLFPGGPQRTVRMVRVWLNSDPEPFAYEFTGPFTFEVDLPPAGWSPFLRVVEGDVSRVAAEIDGNRMEISVDPPDRTGTFYFEMMVGHLVQPEDGLSLTSRTATIGDWQIDVLDDHDSLSSGEWFYSVNVNGVWRQLLWDADVDTGQSVGILDLFTVSGSDLILQVTGYESDPTIPEGGGESISPDPNTSSLINGFDLGELDNPDASPLGAPGGDWSLHYNVTPGGEMPASLVEQSFWEPRLNDEPNDNRHRDLGDLPVPAPNAAPLTRTHASFLTEPGPSGFPPNGEISLFKGEVDRYSFSLADFANVTFGTLPAPLRLDVEPISRWHHLPPPTLRVEIAPGQTQERDTDDVLGFSAARLEVSSPDGRSGDTAYNIEVHTTYRVVPQDWGESRDAQGRLIDLVTTPPNPAADPRLRIEAPTMWFPEERELAADWAWQHVANDTDVYQVVVPPVAGPPSGHTACRFDNPGQLFIDAYPMTISIPSLGLTRDNTLYLANLRQTLPNGGTLVVNLTASTPPRRLYRLEAEWEGTRYYTPSECDELGRQMAMIRRLTPEGELEIMKGIIALQGGRFPGQSPWPGPDPDPTDLPPLGDFRVIRFEKGGPLDLIVSSPEGQPVLARLFDEDGVLIAEGKGLDEETAGSTPSPAGMVPQTRLRAEGLEPGGLYLLQVVPRDGEQGRQQVPLGFDERKP
ncbi:MAG TPA: LamG domain-containing protein [Thermoanaerobaculia bacterium]|nr:LamG domain-containing protein [Thermoanaerobaculia bacterium]